MFGPITLTFSFHLRHTLKKALLWHVVMLLFLSLVIFPLVLHSWNPSYTTFSPPLQALLDLTLESTSLLLLLEVIRGLSASMKTVIAAVFCYVLCTYVSPRIRS